MEALIGGPGGGPDLDRAEAQPVVVHELGDIDRDLDEITGLDIKRGVPGAAHDGPFIAERQEGQRNRDHGHDHGPFNLGLSSG